ncbi:hypothetical protein F7018_13985 [Tenacibaculum aiptasiae]|uniref:Histidine kinase n=1 Tax=Tenacibaculum aiptasiae TaxID=426481 RepID=A0A7J5AAY6_9FLAO|nr:histidine kinase [Tenacibaculum aiptasiae]KAB1154633.1 hypothetical protein F7018_13985 [Tenacibaculum aiptasiae]
MINKITLYLYFILLFSSAVSFSQHPVFEHLTEKDGLPDIEFYDVLEDEKGYIWLAADKGLFRYDGKEFKNYSHPKKRALSVFGLRLDSQGRVWCNNITGQFFYVENDELKLFIDIEEQANGQLAEFLFFKDYLIIINYWYILNVNLKTKESKLINNNNYIATVFKKKDTLFYLSESKMNYSTNGKTFKRIQSLKNTVKYSGINWRSFKFQNKQFHYSYDFNGDVVKSHKGMLVVEENNELIKVKLPEDLKKHFTIRIFIRNNELWFCTEIGVYICKYENKEIKHVKSYFKGKQITQVITDSNNNYWCSTLRDGIFIIPNIYLNKYKSKDVNQNISAMSKVGKDKVLFGSTNGYLTLLNVVTGEKKDIDVGSKEKVFSIIGLDKEKALISFASNSVILNVNTLKYRKLKSYGNAKDFSLYKDGKIIFAAFAYASINHVKDNEERVRIGGKRSYSAHYSKLSKKIYVGYVDGVKVYDEELNSTPVLYKNKPIFALDIEETADGTIWMSTFKDGLIGVKNGKAYVNYTKENGLISNLTSVIKASENSLWISTNRGIQVLDVKSGTFKNLTKRDGVNSYNISDIVVFDKSVFFSSNKGVFEVDKDKVFKEMDVQDFYFSDVLVNDEHLEIKDTYSLKHNENKIQFKFHANGFLTEESLQYKYRLIKDKKNDKWDVLYKGVDQITFNDLSAGKYRFELKTVDFNGDKESDIKKIDIEIQLPFYKEWWFIISGITSLFLVIWYRFNARLKMLKRKQEEVLERERMQKQLVSSKLESLQSQMNPHFTFNALNSIQNLVLKGDKYKAYDYLTKFSLLIRENLNMSKKSFVHFDEELQLLKKYLELEKLRFKEEFSYKIIGNENVGDIKIPTMIIQPYIENALKHGLLHKEGDDKKVLIEFKQEDVLICIITDNGIGIKAAKELKIQNKVTRESFSTKAIDDKLIFLKEYYKVDIGVSFEDLEEGTRVVVRLPYTIGL